MNADQIYDAIGEVGDDLIQDALTVPVRSRGRLLRNLVAACLMIFLFALPVSAELRTGYISNLLAPLYGGAQTELVDSVGIPINASTTVNGYTLSADAVIGDRYNLAIVYTLRREDGGQLPEGLQFDEHKRTMGARGLPFLSGFGGGGGGGFASQKLNEDKTELKILTTWSGNYKMSIFRRKVHVEFTDLVIWKKGEEEDLLVQEGVWELDFTIRYRDTTTTIRVDDLVVHNSEGDEFTVHKVELSPFGVSIKLTVPNAVYGMPEPTGKMTEEEILARSPKHFEFALLLKDGSVVSIEGGANSGGSVEKPTHKGSYHAMFDTPVPLEQIEALIFCDTPMPLD